MHALKRKVTKDAWNLLKRKAAIVEAYTCRKRNYFEIKANVIHLVSFAFGLSGLSLRPLEMAQDLHDVLVCSTF